MLERTDDRLGSRPGRALGAGLAACDETPTEAPARAPALDHAGNHGSHTPPGQARKGPHLHFAQVRGFPNPAVVKGTATGIERLGVGAYLVRFPSNLRDCAATANTSGFDGQGNTALGVLHLAMGIPEDDVVSVQSRHLTGTPADNSFTLVVACP